MKLKQIMILPLLVLPTLEALAVDQGDFAQPQQTYRPKTWIHLMNGNISKAGLTKDIKSLADAGVGGALFFNLGSKHTPEGPVAFGSDAYQDALLHAIGEADHHGLDIGLHNCDGWTASGGPWVTPEMSMKKIVWSEQTAMGGQAVTINQPAFGEGLYQDLAVLAWPVTAYDQQDFFSSVKLTSSQPEIDTNLARLTDSDLDTEFVFKDNKTNSYWLQAELKPELKKGAKQTLRSVHVEVTKPGSKASLFVSNDGMSFKKIAGLQKSRIGKKIWGYHGQIDPQQGKYFRIVFSKPVAVRRLELWSDPRDSNWLVNNVMARGDISLTPQVESAAVIDEKTIKVLSRGELTDNSINLPAGKWRVVRFGYTSTGARNAPASRTGEGLEVDKLNADAMRFHLEQYVGKMAIAAKAKGYSALRFTEIDSFEGGGQNWTQGLESEFKSAFGYDFIPWLPAITGRVINSSIATGAVLQELRTLIAQRMVDNYYGTFTEVAHKYGMETYIEPYGMGPLDELSVGSKADRPMTEFWVDKEYYVGRFRAASSASHLYGKGIVSAEAFTSMDHINWRGHPYKYKFYGDRAWAHGVNEMVFHRFAHQANTHVQPGMTMDGFGSNIDRTQTWWDSAGYAWFDYLARGSYLLRQGVHVADLLVHVGDIKPLRMLPHNFADIPRGVKYDYVNTQSLLDRVSVKNGLLVTPSGAQYRALVLYASERLTLQTVTRIKALVEAGATVIGMRPQLPIGYSELTKPEQFNQVVNAVWGEQVAGRQSNTVRRIGQGKLLPLTPKAALAHLAINASFSADFKINGQAVNTFSHRRVGVNDLYYFYNDLDIPRTININVRSGDGMPELWHVDTGTVEKLAQYQHEGRRLSTALTLEPYGSRFMLIRRDNKAPTYTGHKNQLLRAVYNQKGKKVEGDWQVYFDPNSKGAGAVTFNYLADWAHHSDDKIRYYSGKALYTKIIKISPAQLAAGKPLYLDLGDVRVVARVTLNGQPLGTLWKPPYALDISSVAKAGNNTLAIEVTNLWSNRLIGDAYLPDTSGYLQGKKMPAWYSNNQVPPKSERMTFTTFDFYADKANRHLEASGLLGPVRVIGQEK